MGWWEQLRTFESPEDRWVDLAWVSRSNTYYKEGDYSALMAIPTGCSGSFAFSATGHDLSSYPPNANLCAWLYVDTVASMGVTGYFRLGFSTRFDYTDIDKSWTQPNLSNGWNFLSTPLSSLNNYSTRNLENLMRLIVHFDVGAATNFYLDDVYISTDNEKILDTEPAYQIKHFERYNVANARNQEYVGVLEPISFNYNKSLNQTGQATLTFDIYEWDNLPTYRDSVRIYRNGMCVLDGVVVNKEKDFINNICIMTCFTSDFILKEIYDSASSYFFVSSFGDVFEVLADFTHNSDDYDVSNSWQQKGFGIDVLEPEGKHASSLSQYYTIPKDEFVNPHSMITDFQEKYQFDFEMRPPMLPSFWYPQKGRTISQKLFQGTHFGVNKIIENGVDLATMCRARSRGAGAAWSSTQYDATAMNTYGRLAKLISTQGKSTTEVQNAASEYVDIYKDPATIFDIELLPGGWIYPWDLGDTITCVIEGVEYSKRIYAVSVEATQEGERVELSLQ